MIPVTVDHVKAEFLAGTIDESIALSWLFNPLKPEGGKPAGLCFCFTLEKSFSILNEWKRLLRESA